MTTKKAEKKAWDRFQEVGRNVWLAGLGTVSAIDDGSRQFFSQLVERGEKVEKEVPSIEERFRDVGDELRTFGRNVERGVEDRMTATLERFGVPSRDDVKTLSDRVEELTRKIEALAKQHR
jgi:poly(hydroxyalkanoate) granule-associated protein